MELIDGRVDPHNWIDMRVLGMGSVQRSFHSGSLGQRLGEAKLAKYPVAVEKVRFRVKRAKIRG